MKLSPTLLWLALNCSVTVTVTAAPAGAVSVTGGGGGVEQHQQPERQQAAEAQVASQEPLLEVVRESWRSLAKSPVQRAGAVPSGVALWVGVGAGVELLHPPRNRPLKELSLLQQRSISCALFSPVTGI